MAKKKKSFFRKLRRKLKRTTRFKRGMFYYITIATIALIAFFIFFNIFIASYENGMPKHAMEALVKKYEKGQIEDIIEDYAASANKFESSDALVNAYSALFDGKEITYSEDSDYREDTPVYDLKADGITVSKVTLGSDSKGLFGFKKWKVADINYYDYLYSAKTITISAPADSTVYVNGIEVDDSFVTATGEVPALLANVTAYLTTVPTNTTYTIPGFFETPTVTAKDASGNDLSVNASGNNYSVGKTASADFIASMDPYITDIMELYGKKYINIGGSMMAYLIEGAPFEQNVSLSNTYWYPSEYISNYEFSNESISNYVIYSDECFSVDIYFDLTVDFSNASYKTQNENADMTWVFIKEGDKYKLADFAYKSEK